jgi:hypothetical protein
LSYREPSAGSAIVGCFLVLMGICLIFVGGGCTLMLVGFGVGRNLGDLVFLAISVGILVGGVKMARVGFRSLGG